MRRTSTSFSVVILFALCVTGCRQEASSSATITATPTPLSIVANTPAASSVPTAEPTITMTPTATPTGPVLPSGPDLLIQSFTILKAEWTGLGGFEATVKVVVQNASNESASGFEVGIVGVNRENKYVRFNFPYDPALTAALAPGQEVTLTSKIDLIWHGHFDITCADDTYDPTQCAMHDKTALWLVAIADYCKGDEVPDHCAVEEINEENNLSEPVVVEKAGQ